jgi:hypothetical protein
MLASSKTRFCFVCIFPREVHQLTISRVETETKMILGKGSRSIFLIFRWTLSVFMLCTLVSFPLFGQGTSGTIVGTVLDPSGAAVANASVNIKNQGTNETRIAKTGADGGYSMPLLPPGNYQVSVEVSGFAKAITGVVSLSVNQTARIDVTLSIGQSAQAIQVTGEAPLIQTDTSSLGNVIDQTNVSTLPLNQRNWVSFTYLVPGAQFPAEGSIDSTQGLALSVNGARETANNFLIDGIDDNDLVINQYAAIPSLDAVQEFKVQSGVWP